MKKLMFAALLALVLVLPLAAQQAEDRTALLDVLTVPEMTTYSCHHIDREIKLGKDDALWEKAEPTKWRLTWTDREPTSRTEAGLLWSDKYLYVRFTAYDKDIFGLHTERDAFTCQDDACEIFFKTDPNKDPYYNFEINPLGTIYDSYQPSRRLEGRDRRFQTWNCKGLKRAVKIYGTLNNYRDEDQYWVLEEAIPFAELELPGGKKIPAEGDLWGLMLSRYEFSVHLPGIGLEQPTTGRYVQEHPNFHDPTYWNRMKFVK